MVIAEDSLTYIVELTGCVIHNTVIKSSTSVKALPNKTLC